MSRVLGPAIEEINGFTVHEIFVLGAGGEYISVGYGVFGPEGQLIAAFPDMDSALAHLESLAGHKPSGPSF